MSFKCRATHVLWVIWDEQFMVTLIFKFDPRKCQVQVKLGQIRSNFKIKHFITHICLSCADLSYDSKNVIYLYVRQIEMPKIAFQKCGVITFTCYFFGTLHSQKQIYCFEILYAWCLHVFRSHILRFFLDNLNVPDFIWNYSSKIENFEFWGSKLKNIKIRDDFL